MMQNNNQSKNSEYIMGVIGGMGSKSTSYFLDEVFAKTKAKRDQDHINLICFNHSTLPDRTELIEKNESEPLVSMLKKDIKDLTDLGVKFIAIPCNTVFHFINQLKEDNGVQIISIIDESVKFISEKFPGVRKIGILGTNGTRKSKIFNKAFEKTEIEIQYPTDEVQLKIMDIIYKQVKEDGTDGNFMQLIEIAEDLRNEQNCDIVILGCTELSYVRKGQRLPDYLIDTLDCLVRKSIILSGKELIK